jgi:hypothetical protein
MITDMKSRNIAFVNALFLSLLALPAVAGSAPNKVSSSTAPVSATISAVLDRPALKYASVGVLARS